MFLPPEAYKYPSFLDELEQEGQNQPEFIRESFVLENEPLVKIKDTDIPYRLLVGDEELEAINIFKASLIATLTILNSLNIIPTLISLLSIKYCNKVAGRLTRLGFRTIRPLILKNKHWSTFHKEFYVLIFAFLIKLKINDQHARELAEYVSYTIEYDTAYKTRLQDLFEEADLIQLNSRPITEIRRLLKVFIARNKDKNMVKYRQFAQVLIFALCIPHFRRIFRECINHVDWKNLYPDNIDKYWNSMRIEYDYEGKTLKERLEEGFKKWKYVHSKEEYLQHEI